jgi:hypothetical protein
MISNQRVGDDLLMDALRQREDYLHEATDSLDTKASQIFAAAAFLAVQPSVLLVQPHLSGSVIAVQLIAAFLLLVSVFLAYSILQIEEYPSPGFAEEWRDGILNSTDPEALEETVRCTLLWGLIDQAKDRIENCIQKNEDKAKKLINARVVLLSAMILNLASLILFVLSRRV